LVYPLLFPVKNRNVDDISIFNKELIINLHLKTQKVLLFYGNRSYGWFFALLLKF
jgi:hypothetical protein